MPGGTQLLSKRPEMFLPGGWPGYYASARGITVTDLDGNTFRDFSIGGVGATVLGYGDACREVFALIASAKATGSVAGRLRGPVAHSGFKRLT